MKKFNELYESLINEAKELPEWNKPHKDSKATTANAKARLSNWAASGHFDDFFYNYGLKKGTATKENVLENKGYKALADWVNKTDFINIAVEPRPHRVYGGDSSGDENTNFEDKQTIFDYIIDGIPRYSNYGKLDRIALMYMGYKPIDLSKYVFNGQRSGVTEDWPRGRPQISINVPKKELAKMAEELLTAFPVLIYSRFITGAIDEYTVNQIKKKMSAEGTYKVPVDRRD